MISQDNKILDKEIFNELIQFINKLLANGN